MLKLIIVCLLIANCYAHYGYGGGGGGKGYGYAINAAIHSRHSVDVKHVPTFSGGIHPQTVIVEPEHVPINLHFKSTSSNLKVSQSHYGGQGGHEHTSSVDQPWRLTHDVQRPVIQEVREVIVPFRRVTQEIRPVQEEIRTVVAQGNGGGAGGGLGGGAGGGFGGGFGGGHGGGFAKGGAGGYGGGGYGGGGHGGDDEGHDSY